MAVLAHVADWLLAWFVHASVGAAVALGAGRLLSTGRSRDLLWKTALILPLVTSLWSVGFVPNWRHPVSVVGFARRFMPAPLRTTRVSVQPVAQSEQPVITVQDDGSRALQIAILVVILLPAVVACSRMAIQRRRLRQSLRGRRVLSPESLGIDVRALSPRGDTVHLTVSPNVDSAAAVGPSEICVSDSLVALGRAEKEAVITHELAHVERGDVAWTLLADAIGCVLSAQPLVRMVARRFGRDAEFICDDVAVHRIGDARAYVRTLLRFAMPFDSAEGAIGYGSSPVVERAERLLQPRALVAPSHMWAAPLIAALLVGSLIALPRLTMQPETVAVRTQTSSRTSVATRKEIRVTLRRK